jgi:hypothetical protein
MMAASPMAAHRACGLARRMSRTEEFGAAFAHAYPPPRGASRQRWRRCRGRSCTGDVIGTRGRDGRIHGN